MTETLSIHPTGGPSSTGGVPKSRKTPNAREATGVIGSKI